MTENLGGPHATSCPEETGFGICYCRCGKCRDRHGRCVCPPCQAWHGDRRAETTERPAPAGPDRERNGARAPFLIPDEAHEWLERQPDMTDNPRTVLPIPAGCEEILIRSGFGTYTVALRNPERGTGTGHVVRAHAIVIRDDGRIEFHHETDDFLVSQLTELVDDLCADEPCRFDDRGHCEEHGWSNEGLTCPHARAKGLLRSLGRDVEDES